MIYMIETGCQQYYSGGSITWIMFWGQEKGYLAKLLFSSTIDATLLEIEALHTATKCH